MGILNIEFTKSLFKKSKLFLLIAAAVHSLLFSKALAQSNTESLAQVEPQRVFDGSAFSEAVLAEVQKQEPNLKVFIANSEVTASKDDSNSVNRREIINGSTLLTFAARSPDEFVKGLAIGSIATLFSKQTVQFISSLYVGQPIYFVDKKNADLLASVQDNLHRWISQQPDHSIEPHTLLAKAIVHSNGHLLMALIATWNITSENWITAPTRNFSLIPNKLIDITGESHLRNGTGQFIILPENLAKETEGKSILWENEVKKDYGQKIVQDRIKFVVTKRGDNFSTLYHFMGVTLFTVYLSEYFNSTWISTFFAKLAVKAEAIIHRITSGGAIERQKRIYNDLQGAQAGIAFFKHIRQNKAISTNAYRWSHYLKNNFTNTEYNKIFENQPPAYFEYKNAEKKYWTGPMGPDELYMRFEHAIWRNPKIFDPVILTSSTDGERLLVGLDLYLKQIQSGAEGHKDLNYLIRAYHKGFRGAAYDFDVNDFEIELSENEKNLKQTFKNYDLLEISNRLNRLIDLIQSNLKEQKRSCSRVFSQR